MKPTIPALIPWDVTLRACALSPVELDHALLTGGEYNAPTLTAKFDGIDAHRNFVYLITWTDRTGRGMSQHINVYVVQQPVSQHFTFVAYAQVEHG